MPRLYNQGNSRQAVIDHVRELENRPDVVARYSQHEADEHIWDLRPYQLEEVSSFKADPREYPSVTLNGPRTFWNAIRRSLTANPPRIRFELPPIGSGPLDEQGFARQLEETARHERFAMGLLQDVDEVRIRSDKQPLQLDLAWYFGIRGGAVTRVWFDPDAPHALTVQEWDPLTVTYERGMGGLSFAAHHYWTPHYDVRERYPDSVENLHADQDGNVEVFDCWWLEDEKVYNAIYTPECDLKPAEVMPKQDHLPIFVVRAFGPDIEGSYQRQNQQADRTRKAWESMYTANKETYAQINRIATLYSLYLRRNAIGPYQGRTGISDDKELKKALQPFGFIDLPADGIPVTPVAPPTMAQEVKEFFAEMQGAEQRGSIPHSVYGQIPFQLSGFAVNQLQGAVSIVAGQMATQMAWMYRLIVDEAVQQFKARGRKLMVRGSDRRRRPFIEDFKRSDIRDKYHIEVDLTPELPVDKAQEAQVAQAWSGLGVDPITIADEILHLDDPRQLLQRMVIWQKLQAELMPPQPGPGGPGVPPEMGNTAASQGQVPPSPQADTGQVPEVPV